MRENLTAVWDRITCVFGENWDIAWPVLAMLAGAAFLGWLLGWIGRSVGYKALMAKFNSKNTAYAQLSEESSSLSSELSKWKSKYETRDRDYNEKLNFISHLEKDIEDLENRKGNPEEVDRLLVQLNSIETENTQLKAKNKDYNILSKKLEKVSKVESSVNDKFLKLKSEYSELEGDYKSVLKINEDLKNRPAKETVKEIIKDDPKLRQRILDLEKYNGELIVRMEQAESRLTIQDNSVSEKNALLKNMDSNESKLAAAIALQQSLQQKYSGHESTEKKLSSEISRLKESLSKSESQISEMKSSISPFEAENVKLKARLNTLELENKKFADADKAQKEAIVRAKAEAEANKEAAAKQKLAEEAKAKEVAARKKADDQKKADELKKAEEKKKADELRKASEEKERQEKAKAEKASADKVAQEKAELEAKKQEDDRKAEAQKAEREKAEQEKKADEASKAKIAAEQEEKRIAAEQKAQKEALAKRQEKESKEKDEKSEKQKAAEAAKQEREKKRKAEEEAVRAEQEERNRLAAEAKKAEEAKRKAEEIAERKKREEAEAKRKAEVEAKRKAEVEERAKREAEKKRKAEAKKKAEQEVELETEEDILARIQKKSAKLNFTRIGKAASKADDLKEISGIGPFIEKKLNALGINSFVQIANLGSKDQDEVNQAIEFFPGRVKRDDWVGQAKKFISTQKETKTEESSSKEPEDVILNRVRKRASRINFGRIGKASMRPDDLKKINGIGPFIERKLFALGINSYSQISNFSDNDQDLINEFIEFFPGRVKRDNWIGQAQELMNPSEKKSESIETNKENTTSKKAEAPKAANAQEEEILKRVQAKSKKVDFARIGQADGNKDELQKIKGIGPFSEKKLNALGIYTFTQISKFNAKDMDMINEFIEFFPGRVKRDDWVGQAKRLMS